MQWRTTSLALLAAGLAVAMLWAGDARAQVRAEPFASIGGSANALPWEVEFVPADGRARMAAHCRATRASGNRAGLRFVAADSLSAIDFMETGALQPGNSYEVEYWFDRDPASVTTATAQMIRDNDGAQWMRIQEPDGPGVHEVLSHGAVRTFTIKVKAGRDQWTYSVESGKQASESLFKCYDDRVAAAQQAAPAPPVAQLPRPATPFPQVVQAPPPPGPAPADTAEDFCLRYANSIIATNYRGMQRQCPQFRNANMDWEAHFNWCGGQPQQLVAAADEANMSKLDGCMTAPAAPSPRVVQAPPPPPLPPPPRRDDADGGSFYLRALGNLCVDVLAGQFRQGAIVQLWQCHGGEAQRFGLDPRSGRVYPVVAPMFCVDARDTQPLRLTDCNRASAQWGYDPRSGTIRSSTGLCWDVPGANLDPRKYRPGQGLVGWRCNGQPNQGFVFNQ